MSAAQWTRATYMQQTRNAADATSAGRWTEPEVVAALGISHTREWKRLLNANRYLRFAQRAATQDANGQFTLASLDSGSGDTQQRLYRVMDIADGTRVYNEVQFAEVPVATVIATANTSYCWYRIGDVIQMLPIASAVVVTVSLNHIPTPIDQLSADTVFAEFPRDYEPIVALEAAALLLEKGGAEAGAASVMAQRAESIRQDMLSDLARVSTSPLRMSYPDTRHVWNG